MGQLFTIPSVLPSSMVDVEMIYTTWKDGSKIGDAYLMKFAVWSQDQEGSQVREMRAHHGLFVDVAGASNDEEFRGVLFRMHIAC
jgi:uncharacterized protein (UPF0264 family)